MLCDQWASVSILCNKTCTYLRISHQSNYARSAINLRRKESSGCWAYIATQTNVLHNYAVTTKRLPVD